MSNDNNVVHNLKASLAVQVRTNLRMSQEWSYSELVMRFKKEKSVNEKDYKYLYAFFEECYPSLIKKFMLEQSISRDEIVDVFNSLPFSVEKIQFQELLDCGKF